MAAVPDIADSWSPVDWRRRKLVQQPEYADQAMLAEVELKLASAVPVVSIAECVALRALAGEVERGSGFILQGGDCAETLGQPQAEVVAGVAGLFDRLSSALPQPAVNIARIAGQFAKPRTKPTETRGLITLPAYRGDAINSSVFSADAREPDPARMLLVHDQAVETASLLAQARAGQTPIFTSHEALLLPTEQALARPDGAGRWWATSGHMLWVGDRSRQVDGAHIRFVSGIENFVGVKCGPGLGVDELLRLLDRIDPANRQGKIALIGRFGAEAIESHLPLLMQATKREGRRVLWMTDPMHGNGRIEHGRKVRRMSDMLAELRAFFAIARANDVHPAGLHLEMTPADVTECIADDAADGGQAFEGVCDPRLNPAQAEAMARCVAELVHQPE